MEMNKQFEKQVMKLTPSSFCIIIPSKIVKEFGIEAGDVITGVFVSIQKNKSTKEQKDLKV